MMEQFSRKQFVKRLVVLFTTLSLFGGESEIIGKEPKKEEKLIPIPDGEKPVSENDLTAQALGFHHNAKDTDFILFPERKLPQSKNQVCLQCAQFTKLNDGWGKCTILTSGVVSNVGWCSAWSKKS
jgi:hypothetical protein